MQKDNQKTQKSIPWYHTRWFWGGVIVMLVVGSTIAFLPTLQVLPIEESIRFFLLIQGAALALALTISIFGSVGLGLWITIFAEILYLIIMWSFVYKTFKNRKVQLQYPLRFVANFVLSLIWVYIVTNASISFL